jgi:hypothetical protein
MANLKEGSIRNRVSALIRAQGDMAFCNECIHSILGRGSHSAVNEVTRYLDRGGSMLGFERSSAKCGACGQTRMVIYVIKARLASAGERRWAIPR